MKKKFGLAGLVVLMLMLALGAAAEEGNTIIIGCDMYAPYTYKNGTGEFVGVDVDFATEAFGRLGYAVQFREIVWENKQSYLDSGEVDCLWSCFTMSGREDEYTWAGPYLYSRQVAMVRADSDYTELSQLAGRRAAVQASRPERNGSRWHLRRKRFATWYVTVMKAIRVHLWTEASWKATRIA